MKLIVVIFGCDLPLSVRGMIVGDQLGRAPKSAVPIRTIVLPAAMAAE